ncbi:phosphoenolpyruvate--protein phosphotransferase [Micromonospora sp. NBC_01796]|uniref:phosphoenolpyruvate--protein phosphotransferase n=1 Tax=Micromonospora sp. NBC_01796 TaxID=2975987 RepID=UPI002DDAA467|nr:phosphoenolpyruvate--protein phosphotransferase [Micromonospora sp. NBC_01796]WSA85107.1 phosphoenolpyruvate--protein phosphotransferase [Micromonospora sp. NBC_01796]
MPESSAPQPLRGIGVSRGVAGGPLLRVGAVPTLPAPAPVDDPAGEADRAIAALAEVVAELGRRADRAREQTVADVLRAQAMMADDPVLADGVREEVAAGRDAPHAIDAAFATHRAAFEAAGGYLAERVADLDDLRDRAVAVCLGLPMPGVPAPGHRYVLAARDLAPADTVDLDPEQVVALVTEVGGPTSHTAILARALGLPAVVGVTGLGDLDDGTVVLVDGTTGLVEAGLDDAALAARLSVATATAGTAAVSGPGRTSDGHPIALLANVGAAREVPPVDDAEGVGLFRTELLFLDRTREPGSDEQAAAYREVFDRMDGRRVVIRTLDAGADKPLPFLRQAEEPNPALGVRGLRVARRQPAVLRTQLEAIARAAADTGADVWVMAPMVATRAEAAGFAEAVHAAGLPKAGVMIEVPAAALRAGQLLDVVDFLSIGTNDLSQYTFAADRQCGDLAELLDPWQPALLQLIAVVATAGRAAGKPVGVCGEAAADPLLAPVLAGLGVTSLSMSGPALPWVRAALAEHTFADCERLAKLALDADDARHARALVGVA